MSWLLRLRRKTRLADLVPGRTATIEGTVSSPNRLQLRPADQPCAYYAILHEVYQHGARGGGRPLWYCDRFEARSNGFAVSDGERSVWVEESGENLVVFGARQVSGPEGKNRRYAGSFFGQGDVVRLRGVVGAPGRSDPEQRLVITAPPGKRLPVLVKLQAKSGKP